MKKQKDTSTLRSASSSLCSEQILRKLSTLEELLKKKDDKPLTFKEACIYLGYAPSYLYKLTYRKVIPHYKPTGKMIFFSKNEIDEWIYRSSDECKVMSDELKEEKNIEKDLNQIEMGFDEKRNEKNNETEILIEFPLKSRRKK
jgi:excisionase family DNA binding protein